jgi:hypothetical protein
MAWRISPTIIVCRLYMYCKKAPARLGIEFSTKTQVWRLGCVEFAVYVAMIESVVILSPSPRLVVFVADSVVMISSNMCRLCRVQLQDGISSLIFHGAQQTDLDLGMKLRTLEKVGSLGTTRGGCAKTPECLLLMKPSADINRRKGSGSRRRKTVRKGKRDRKRHVVWDAVGRQATCRSVPGGVLKGPGGGT